MNEQTAPAWPAGTRLLRVADVVVDLECRELERDAGTVELQQRVFDLLLVLLREPGVLHTRASLFERVWPGVVVEDANLSQAVWVLRGALGEERRGWIRTVPKRGYLFEPPEPPRPVDLPPPARPGPAFGATPAPTPAPAPVAGQARPRRRGRRWAIAGALSGMLAAGLVLAKVAFQPAPPPLEEAPVTVAVLQVGDGADGRWPALLLQAWLEWKLSTLPEVEVVDGDRLAADAVVVAPHVVLLSAGLDAGGGDRHYVRARLDTRTGPRQMEMRGQAAEVPRLVDALSRQVLEALLPERAAEPWPALEVDAVAAREYVDAWKAYEARDLAAAARGLETVLVQSPGFGLAQLQLGTARARLGQARVAGGHVARARELLRPLGMDSERLMSVHELSVDPARATEAAAALGALVREHPGRLSLRLDQAGHLVRAGDPDAAAAVLGDLDWVRQPLELRIRWRIVRAHLAAARADPQRVREHAAAAERLALQAGDAWDRERAAAIHLQAQADVFEHGAGADLARFEQAAALFAGAGAELDALYARVNAGLARPDAGDGTGLDRLLAQSRAGGYREMEIRLLRKMAYRHFVRGEFDAYRRRLEEALAVSVAAGGAVARREIELDLLGDGLMAGRFDRVRERIRHLRADPSGGDAAAWLDQMEAALLGLEGDHAAAVAVLEQTRRRLEHEGRPPLPDSTLARVACDRAAYLLPQGRMEAVREALDQCGTRPQAATALRLPALRAWTDLLTGDATAAAAVIERLARDVDDRAPGPAAWRPALELAYLEVRAGSPRRALSRYQDIATVLRGSGFAGMQAEAAVGEAEALLALGEWQGAAAAAARVDDLLVRVPWTLAHRAERVHALSLLGRGERSEATRRLQALHRQAHRHGDVIAQLELHSVAERQALPAGCDEAAQRAQLAASGLRGARLDWVALPGSAPAAAASARLAAGPGAPY